MLQAALLAAREDIALRAASEEALRLTQFSIDQSTVGILWVNWDSHVRYANRAAEEMLGYP
ncbi:PAS domain-containing protein, partial [Pseudomonas protegens]|uniref:PAS domain-containing protein n=1 Tax=Pseudomonas protegens TaxID=380021 RepID=UPI003D152EA0